MKSLFFSFAALIATTQSLTNHTFPPDFIFGAATASYQIEGAWNHEGESIIKTCIVSHIYGRNHIDLKLTPWSRVLVEKLTVAQTFKKLPAFYGNRNLIYISKSLVPVLSQINPAHTLSHFPKINFNIIISSTSRFF
jgi:hypothetical protein